METRMLSREDLERCAFECHECQDACLGLIPHCLGLGGEHASVEHINTLIDCAAICGVSHSLLHRGSNLHGHTCRACAEICRACAHDCTRLAGGDKDMTNCAAVCNRCADVCEKMAA